MKQGTRTIVTLGVASVFALTVGMSTVWANEPGYGKGRTREGRTGDSSDGRADDGHDEDDGQDAQQAPAT